MPENLQHLVDTASSSIAAAAVLAERDVSRPQYHFRGVAQWMDDPNGIIFHKGMYHMMYSLNPHTAAHRAGMVYKTAVRVWDPNSEDWTGGITVWGHARSPDMVHWEHLPIAIYPRVERGEHFVWFGCSVINDDGVPMAIYTAVGPEMRPEDTAEQWAAVGDKDLINWKHVPSNPIVPASLHGDDVIREWRDPFIFKDGARTFMIIGGRDLKEDGGRPVVALYEAQNTDFSAWAYRGIIFRHPRKNVPSAECPNIVRFGDKWVLFVSPHAEVEYYVGTLDLKNFTFVVESTGIVDHSRNFYATNVLLDETGRAIMWGAIVGFRGTAHWNGCVSLPRVLSLGPDGALRQEPVVELREIRGNEISVEKRLSAGMEEELSAISDAQAVEILAEVHHSSGSDFTFWIEHISGRLEINFRQDELHVAGLTIGRRGAKSLTRFQLYIDRTVLEIYVDETDCATIVIPLVSGNGTVGLSCNIGEINQSDIRIWQLNAGDLFTSSDQ